MFTHTHTHTYCADVLCTVFLSVTARYLCVCVCVSVWPTHPTTFVFIMPPQTKPPSATDSTRNPTLLANIQIGLSVGHGVFVCSCARTCGESCGADIAHFGGFADTHVWPWTCDAAGTRVKCSTGCIYTYINEVFVCARVLSIFCYLIYSFLHPNKQIPNTKIMNSRNLNK